MEKFYYDFHIHSCLSPCADNDSTPHNIAGMAALCGLNIVALTDHNSTKNCPAFFAAAKKQGIIPIAGMELTTSEDIHVICLFEELSAAMEFDKMLDGYRIPIKNRPEIFGDQLVIDEDERVIATENNLLISSTNISVDAVPSLVASYGGISYPAHIDRASGGIVAVLGTFPDIKGYNCYELNDKSRLVDYKNLKVLESKRMLVGSDAHNLADIKEKENFFELESEPYSSALIRKRLFEYLR